VKEIYDYLRVFFELRKSLDPSDRFNFILFKESGPNFLEDFTLDPEKVLNALKDLEPEIVRANVAGGIFTALTLITEGFKEIYNKRRPPIERKIAELIFHGLRKARYIGKRKSRLQALFTAAAVNLKRIFKEQQEKKVILDIVEDIPALA